jgi:tetratricopeptide (TPR) repeat protein
VQLWPVDRTLTERELHRRGHFSSSGNDEEEAPAEMRASGLISTGIRFFKENQIDGSEAIFRAVVERFPEIAMAHNNLGFTLMAQGRFSEALAHLLRAAELPYENEDVLLANLGCCYYMLSDQETALARFRECLHHHSAARGTVLFGIDDQQLVLLELQSAGDYVSLAALNAGWSAYRSRRMGSAREYAEIAATGRLTFTDTAGSKSKFDQALTHLEERIGTRQEPEGPGLFPDVQPS